MAKVGMKREISSLVGEKGLKNLFHMTNFCLVGIHCFKGLPKGSFRLNACKRLNDVLLNVVKHPRNNSQVILQPRGIIWVTMWRRVDYEMMKRIMRLKKKLETRCPGRIIMAAKTVSKLSKLFYD